MHFEDKIVHLFFSPTKKDDYKRKYLAICNLLYYKENLNIINETLILK